MSTSLITITPEAQELIAFAQTFLGTAQAVKITSPEEMQAAVDQTRAIKECAKAVEDTRKSYTQPLDEQKKEWMDLFRPATDVLTKAEGLLKSAILAYQQEEQRKAREAEAERRRLEKIEADRLKKEQEEAEALLRKSDEAAASGDIAAAEALEAQAMAVQSASVAIPVSVPVAPVKARGAATTKKWKCRVVDPTKVPRQFCAPDEKALNAYAQAMKENAQVDGCEFYAEDNLAIR